MISMPVLGLGFLVGMQHALEADHIAAVSSIVARGTRMDEVVKHGLTWGIGHTLTLLSFAGAAIVLGWAIPDTVARSLETVVGLMLVVLGAHVLRRLWDGRVHFNQRPDGARRIHPHRQAGDHLPHRSAEREQKREFPWRSLAVGLMHGMAGSAALLVLALSAAAGPMQGMAYVVVFGLGSIIGMGALSVVIAVPFVISARLLNWLNYSLQAVVGLVTIGIGMTTIYTVLAHANV